MYKAHNIYKFHNKCEHELLKYVILANGIVTKVTWRNSVSCDRLK